MKDFLSPIPATFDEDWIAECAATMTTAEGYPPDIDTPLVREFGAPAFLDEEALGRMKQHLRENSSNLESRFAVLRFLWCNLSATLEYDSMEYQYAEDARPRLQEFLFSLDIDAIHTARQAWWELFQAIGLADIDRLMRLCESCIKLEERGSSDALNLLKGRVLWFRGTGSPVPRKFLREFLYGDPRFVSLMALAPPEPDAEFRNRDLVIDAKASFEKVTGNQLGAHWGLVGYCAAATGDPGKAAEIYEKRWEEITGPFVAHMDCGPVEMPPEFRLRIADLWEPAQRPEKVKTTLELIVATSPKMPGVNRRLAEIYNKQNDPRRAVEYLRAEIDADPAFGEDPLISLALKAGIAWEELDHHTKAEAARFKSRPDNEARFAAIRTAIELVWPPFRKISPGVAEDWVEGLFWSSEPPGWSATAAASKSIIYAAKAFESHLRETLYEPLKRAVTAFEIEQLPQERFGPLRSYLNGTRPGIELGPMLDSIRCSRQSYACFQRLTSLIGLRTSHMDRLRSDDWRSIQDVRNASIHDSRTSATIESARRLITLCGSFLFLLENPPPAEPVGPAGKNRFPGRPPS